MSDVSKIVSEIIKNGVPPQLPFGDVKYYVTKDQLDALFGQDSTEILGFAGCAKMPNGSLKYHLPTAWKLFIDGSQKPTVNKIENDLGLEVEYWIGDEFGFGAITINGYNMSPNEILWARETAFESMLHKVSHDSVGS